MNKQDILNGLDSNVDYEKSPIKAIKYFCLSCCGDNYNSMKECTGRNCSLYPFRFGTNPFTHKELTDEQREKAAVRLREIRNNKNNSNYM